MAKVRSAARTTSNTTAQTAVVRSVTTNRSKTEVTTVGPGIVPAKIEMRDMAQADPGAAGSYRVRTLDGRRFAAVLSDEVEPQFAEECLRSGKTVLLVDTERGPTILGAVQTSRGITREASGLTTLTATDLRIRADKTVVIEAGPVSLKLDKNGVMRAEGERMVIDMASLVRVLSALMELP
ncbi:MAG: hypothetical protein IPK82_21575 [Polyangiaceae bacterium]|nr:hypothetical protein [Polyangiaceae bacterium]